MEYQLSKNEILVLNRNLANSSIICEKGVLWITQEADAKDYILKEGERFSTCCKGKTAITGYRDATVRFEKRNTEFQLKTVFFKLLTSFF